MRTNLSILTLFLLLSLVKATQPTLTINGLSPEENLLVKDQGWSFSYSRKLVDKKELTPELRLPAIRWKQHAKYAYMSGYSGDIKLKIKAPGAVTSLKADTKITNYADSVQRPLSISYSLDGVTFIPLAKTSFGSGAKTLSGSVQLPSNRGLLWLRYGLTCAPGDQNGKNGFVLFQQIGLELSGKLSSSPALPKPAVPAGNPYAFKNIFPTGVYWPWERTHVNAEKAGVELWKFVDDQMAQLVDHGCDTVWFVNLPFPLMPRILTMAEKHGLKALLNTELLHNFFNGTRSMETLWHNANKTVNDLGDYPALLGYVLKDEPQMQDLETCNTFYGLMKQADPKRDSIVVVQNRPSMTYLRESKLPVICTDLYYYGHDRSTMLPNPSRTSQAELTSALEGYNTQAELFNKHSWFMGQIFGWVWGRHYIKDGKDIVYPGSYLHWRMPTDEETRWQLWEAVRNGSKGLFIYVLFPPLQLDVPPEQVKPGTEAAKLVADMDRRAKLAASWGDQWLTDKTTVRDDCEEGIVQFGGKPTTQMKAMGDVYRMLRPHAKMLCQKRRSSFPVFFSASPDLDTATFETGDRYRYGVVVNRDLSTSRSFSLLVPSNVTAVKNLHTGSYLALSAQGKHFKQASITLAAGDGMLLQASFGGPCPGIRICRESFDQQTIHKVKLYGNSEIFHHGEFGVDARRSIRLAGDASVPVFSIEKLTNFKSPYTTFAMNLNNRDENGTIFCQLRGRLTSAVLKAVSNQGTAGKSNVGALATENFKQASSDKQGRKSLPLRTGDFLLPVALPVGTTSLDIYLQDKEDYVSDVTLWFVPKGK